jgi:hypothetical protein
MGQEVYVAPPPPRQSSNWSCCLWGCLVAFIIGILIVLALGLGLRSCAIDFREQYTDTAPTALPVVDIDPERLDGLLDQVDTFMQRVQDDQPAPPLELTQDEINALIQNHPDWEGIRDKVYVTIEDDVITGEVSIPLDWVPLMRGRYFNGSVTLDVSLENGRLEVYVDSASVRGEPVPDQVLTGLANQNLAKDIQTDPDMRETLRKLERIQVRNGKVLVTPRQAVEPGDLPPEAIGDPQATPPVAPMPADTDPETAPEP